MEVYHGWLDLFNTKCIIPNMERLACAKECPFGGLRCGEGVKQNNKLCISEITDALKTTDLTIVDKYTVRGSALTSEGSVPVGAVNKGDVEKIEYSQTLAPEMV
jgi:hypothetical protein